MFLIIKLCTYAKLNCLKKLFICIKMDLASNNVQWLIYHKTPTNNFHTAVCFTITNDNPW